MQVVKNLWVIPILGLSIQERIEQYKAKTSLLGLDIQQTSDRVILNSINIGYLG